jgi:hypothetical protein
MSAITTLLFICASQSVQAVPIIERAETTPELIAKSTSPRHGDV